MKKALILIVLLASGWVAPVLAADDSLGRLFSRPAERNNLDILRQNQKLKVVAPEPTDASGEPSAPVELPDPITLQGYVKRSDGSKSTLWINNQPVQEDSTVDNVKIGRLNQRGNSSQEGIDVKIPANGRNVRLRAGQVYEPETNQIKELRIQEKERQLNLEETGTIGSDMPSSATN